LQTLTDFSDASDSAEHIVFLHANGFPPDTYASFLSAISSLGRVSTIEHRPLWTKEAPKFLDWGVYADDAIKTLEREATSPVWLVGHSMGGMVSIVTAANFPNAVATLVVIDSMMRMSEGRAAQLRRIGAGSGRAFDSKAAYVDGFKIRPQADLASPAVTRHMAASSCREYEDGQWRNKFDRHVYSQRHPVDGYAHWAKVWDARIPALVIAGGSSDRITAQVLDQLSAVYPQITISTVDRAGHHVMLDNPRGYIEALAAYLEIDR